MWFALCQAAKRLKEAQDSVDEKGPTLAEWLVKQPGEFCHR